LTSGDDPGFWIIREHSIVDDFNVDRRADGTVESWLESELFAGRESRAAGSLAQLEQIQPTMKHILAWLAVGLSPFISFLAAAPWGWRCSSVRRWCDRHAGGGRSSGRRAATGKPT
jgi:hypothetical protein